MEKIPQAGKLLKVLFDQNSKEKALNGLKVLISHTQICLEGVQYLNNDHISDQEFWNLCPRSVLTQTIMALGYEKINQDSYLFIQLNEINFETMQKLLITLEQDELQLNFLPYQEQPQCILQTNVQQVHQLVEALHQDSIIAVQCKMDDPDFFLVNKLFQASSIVQTHYISQIIKNTVNTRSQLNNQQYLWHGSSFTDPQKILLEGFDLNYASRGIWGRGIYFSKILDLPFKSYAYNINQKSKLLLLCGVKVGKYKTLYNNDTEYRNMTKAPEGFDSVRAYHEFNEIFVVYDDKMCVPLYIIEITTVTL